MLMDYKKRQHSPTDAQSILKEEIAQLQKELEAQTMVRMNFQPSYKSLSQPAEDLVKEIATLELEIEYLEKYLLSLYRRSFAKRLSTLPLKQEDSFNTSTSNPMDPLIDDTGICRSQSSLSHYSACSFRASPTFEAMDAYHSLPLSMLERPQESTSPRLTECREPTPNWISEEMIKCISIIYCHLSDTPTQAHHFEASGSLFHMVEVQGIHRDPQRLNAVEDLLQNYRSLISWLGKIDPGKLKHEEKLAFWINVHNALAMHAFLVYGTPKGNLKRTSVVLKAAYNIGGHTVSVETIQSSILGCRLPRPNQWLQSLFSPKKNFKSGDPRKAYAVKHPEARLHFALCSGCQSDPAVRIYTAKKIFEELEMAKEEYLQMNTKLHKERLIVPKNVECYIKATGLSPSGIAEMLEYSTTESFRTHGKLWKRIEWIPHNFSFRFLLAHEISM